MIKADRYIFLLFLEGSGMHTYMSILFYSILFYSMEIEKLKTLLSQVTDRSEPFNGECFLDTLKALDAYFAQHKDELSPKMRHYLENRGYTKALAYLNDPQYTCQSRD